MDPRFVAVLRNELTRLARDRRALFLAVVLPMLLYPVYFLGARALNKEAERRMDDQVVALLVDVGDLTVDVALVVAQTLTDIDNLSFEQRVFDDTNLPDSSEALESLLAAAQAPKDTTAWLVGRQSESGAQLVLWFDGSNERGLELASRVRDAFTDASSKWVERELKQRLPIDPAEVYAREPRDVAAPVDAAGANFGRWLPLIAVMILVSGGAYAALDAFAAEREQGTLETLLVQPVPVAIVGWAKFAAVSLCGGLALAGNLGSLLISAAVGLVPMGAVDASASGSVLGSVFAGRLAIALLLALPGALLVCAVLCAVSARARTYREAQAAILPLTLGSLLATAPASLPGVELVPTLAAVPLVGTALAMREALSGHLELWPALLSIVASSVAALLALRHVGVLLDLEGLLQHSGSEAEGGARQRRARRALAFGWLAVFLLYFVGGWLQAQSLKYGLAATLWGLALGIALVLAWRQSREEHTKLAREFALVAPPRLVWLAVPIGVIGLAGLAGILLTWQSLVLPLPRGLDAPIVELTTLGPWLGLFLLAFTPGVCEELLFRGAIQSGLQRDFTPLRAILWQAALFGLAHASIHRFLVTFAIGIALGALRWRTRSLLPGMCVHVLYNAALVAPGVGWISADSRLAHAVESPWAVACLPIAIAVVMIAVPRARSTGALAAARP